jgi:hypothetical protein
MDSKKRLTIWYRKNGEDRELVREVATEPDKDVVLLDLLNHEPFQAPLKDCNARTTIESRLNQLRDRGIEYLDSECVDIE